MKPIVLLCAFAAAFVVSPALVAQEAEADTFADTFDGPLGDRWTFAEQAQGAWTLEDGALFMTSDEPTYGRRFALAQFPLTEGVISFEGFVPEGAAGNHRVFGFGPVGKYVDGSSYWFLRAGLWGLSLKGRVDGADFHWTFGAFNNYPNQVRRHEVVLKNGRAAIFIDGVALAIVKDPLAGREGFVGVYAANQCKFTEFSVTRTK